MHAAPHRPTRGNWIWLASGLLAVTVLTGAALRFAPRGCRPATGAATAGRTPAAGVTGSGDQASAVPAVANPGRVTGLAVYYDPGTAVGSCSLGPFRAGGAYVSLPPARYGGGAACGSYLDVSGPDGSVRAEVVDLCPGCAATTINLSRAAFGKIANPVPGSARVTYRLAEDPPLPGPLLVRVSSTSGLLAVQILRHGNPLTAVSVAPVASAAPGAARWHRLTLTANDYWVASSPVTGQVSVRITDDLGHQVILQRLTLRPGTTVRTAVWMYRGAAAGSTGAATVAPSPAGAATRPTSATRPATRPAAPTPGGGSC